MKNNFLMYKWRNTRKIEDTQNFTHSKFMLDFGLVLLSNISCKCLFLKKRRVANVLQINFLLKARKMSNKENQGQSDQSYCVFAVLGSGLAGLISGVLITSLTCFLIQKCKNRFVKLCYESISDETQRQKRI